MQKLLALRTMRQASRNRRGQRKSLFLLGLTLLFGCFSPRQVQQPGPYTVLQIDSTSINGFYWFVFENASSKRVNVLAPQATALPLDSAMYMPLALGCRYRLTLSSLGEMGFTFDDGSFLRPGAILYVEGHVVHHPHDTSQSAYRVAEINGRYVPQRTMVDCIAE